MKKKSFNYRLFLKKNIWGFMILAAAGIVISMWDNSILVKTIVMAETIPNCKVDFNIDKNLEDETIPVVISKSIEHQEEKPIDIGQPETDKELTAQPEPIVMTEQEIEKLKNFEYLKKNLYTIDKRTELLDGDIKAEEFLAMDLSINQDVEGPKILIFHTHSSEGFADSNMSDLNQGIVGVGEELKNILEKKYKIQVMHCSERFDVENGANKILGAYERMEPEIQKIINDNPSIQVVIDMHRDGVRDDVHLITDVNGKSTAKIMFFNGLCRLNEDGKVGNINNLPNPYIKDNLAMSLNMQLAANKLYPNFTRRIYVNAYRYSLNMMPKSLLIEVGAQTNTRQEALNAMEPLADILNHVVSK